MMKDNLVFFLDLIYMSLMNIFVDYLKIESFLSIKGIIEFNERKNVIVQ